MTKTYTFYRDGVPETVQCEAWRWEAHYDDGTVLKQFDDETGQFHQFKEIDQSRLKLFRMVHDNMLPYVLIFRSESMKLIHFYKRAVLDYMGSNPTRITMYCFGYEQNGQKFTVVIAPNEIIVTDDPNIVSAG